MNEAQTWMWGMADKPAILPKTKGSGIMVGNFIDEHNGFLRLSPDELKMPELATSIFQSKQGSYLNTVQQEMGTGQEPSS